MPATDTRLGCDLPALGEPRGRHAGAGDSRRHRSASHRLSMRAGPGHPHGADGRLRHRCRAWHPDPLRRSDPDLQGRQSDGARQDRHHHPRRTKTHRGRRRRSADENRLLTLAASVENASEHPIARAIVDGARERDVKPGEVSEFRSTGARGVSGKVGDEVVLIGNRRLLEEEGVTGLEALDDAMGELEGKGRTVVIVAADGQALGLVAVADTLKQESVEAIRGMHDLGLHVVMITGDNERAARAVAEEVGIDEVQAGVLPEGKVDAIRALQEQHGNHVPWSATASTTPRH